MTRSSDPTPDDHGALSPWERQALAGIEDDLATSDPRLVDAMGRRPGRMRVWWPLSARSTGSLFLALTVLVVVAALLPASSWAVLGIVTTLVVVPWLLLVVIEKNQPD